VTTYRLVDGPTHVVDESDAPLPGHYRAEFRAPDGTIVLRYLTDRGRAGLLHRVDEGRRDLSGAEMDDLTVEPDLEALVGRMEHESGEGA